MSKIYNLLQDFLEWIETHPHGIYYIMENQDAAIEEFLKEREGTHE